MSFFDKTSGVLFVRAVLLISPFILFVVAFVFHLNFSGIRHMSYTFESQSALISPLFPASRLEGVEGGGQAVHGEPVYFTVRALRPYEKAELRVLVTNPWGLPWKVGVQTKHIGDFTYDLHEPMSDGTVSFNLTDARRVTNVYRFIISAPGITEDTPFRVEDIQVRLSGIKGFDLLGSIISTLFVS